MKRPSANVPVTARTTPVGVITARGEPSPGTAGHTTGGTVVVVVDVVVVGRPGPVPQPTGADKTTLMVHLPDNEAGALLHMLDQFAVRGVNLSRIESRPIGDSLGRYSFSIDLEGHLAEERVQATLSGLHRVCPVVRFLGSYPRWDRRSAHLAPGTHDGDFVAAREWVAGLLDGAT